MPRLNIAPSRAAGRASALLLEHVLEHRLVQGQVSHDLLEATILLLERLDPPELGNAHARVLLLPGVEGRLTHPELPAQLGRRRALLRFAQGLGDLLLGVARLLHRRSSVSQRTALQPDSQPSTGPDFGGQVLLAYSIHQSIRCSQDSSRSGVVRKWTMVSVSRISASSGVASKLVSRPGGRRN